MISNHENIEIQNQITTENMFSHDEDHQNALKLPQVAVAYNSQKVHRRNIEMDEIEMSQLEKQELINPFMTNIPPEDSPTKEFKASLMVNKQNSSERSKGGYKHVQNYSIQTFNDEMNSILEISDEDAYSVQYDDKNYFSKL